MIFSVFNYHITNRCNYSCLGCFGKFEGQKDPSLEEAKRIVDAICLYFDENKVKDGRINISGGEPLLYPHLDELIAYICEKGVRSSLITNGSLLTVERIQRWKGLVDMVGISIDAISAETQKELGRCSVGQQPIDWLARYNIFRALQECGIALKINIVVSSRNCEEDFSPLFSVCRPKKVKVLQFHEVAGVNTEARSLHTDSTRFQSFVDRICAALPSGCRVVSEPQGSMENSYLMITPNSNIRINNRGEYQDCPLQGSLSALLEKLSFDCEKYDERYRNDV